MPLFIGVDLGTTSCKVAVYDDEGHLRGESNCEYGLITRSATMIEQDPHEWWKQARRAIDSALTASTVDRQSVVSIAVSSQGISFVLVNESGQPLGNAISWLDTRAGDEATEIRQRFAPHQLYTLTGKRAAPFYVLPKLLWLRQHQADGWKQAHKLLLGHDYLVSLLCGEFVTDHSLAGGTMLYDLHNLHWSNALLDAFDIPDTLLPEIHWAGTPLGRLRASVADELGIPRNTVVVVGGQDQKCAALGAGITDDSATISLGTAAAVIQLMDKPIIDPQMRIPMFTFLQPDRWLLEGVVATGAGALRWYRDTLAGSKTFDQLAAEAESVSIGCEGVMFLPHLSGATAPHWHANTRAAFHGLHLATGAAHLTRAVFEGVAYQICTNLAVTQAVVGQVKTLIVFGGGAKSAFWRQILADVTAREVQWTSSVEAASLGAALLAGLGSGVFASFEAARDCMVQTSAIHTPDDRAVARYSEAYHVYQQLEKHVLALLPQSY